MSETTKPTQVSQPNATAIRELVRQAYRQVDDGGAGLGDDSTLAARAIGYDAGDLEVSLSRRTSALVAATRPSGFGRVG